MNQGIGTTQLILKTARIERIANHRAAIRRQDTRSAGSNQGADLMAARQQGRYQAATKIAAGARDKNLPRGHRSDAGQPLKPAARTECAECARNVQQSLRRG